MTSQRRRWRGVLNSYDPFLNSQTWFTPLLDREGKVTYHFSYEKRITQWEIKYDISLTWSETSVYA